MNSEISEILRVTGMSTTEAEVFLAALELGPSSIWQISKKSGVKRPTCYVALEDLAKKGMAKSSYDGKRVIYSAVSPRQLALIEDRKHNKFINTLSRLEGIACKAASKPDISFREGEVGILEVYNMILSLPKGSELMVYGTSLIPESYAKYVAQYHKVRAGKGIVTKVIMADTTENKKMALDDFLNLQETRFLPSHSFAHQTEVNIFGDTIAYLSHSENEPLATLVESSRFAQEERSKFNVLWEVGRTLEIVGKTYQKPLK